MNKLHFAIPRARALQTSFANWITQKHPSVEPVKCIWFGSREPDISVFLETALVPGCMLPVCASGHELIPAEIRKECSLLNLCPWLLGNELDRYNLADCIYLLLDSNFAVNVKFVLNAISNWQVQIRSNCISWDSLIFIKTWSLHSVSVSQAVTHQETEENRALGRSCALWKTKWDLTRYWVSNFKISLLRRAL